MPKIEILSPLKRVKIEVNPFFYPWEAVKKVLQEFEDVCEWEADENNEIIKIVLVPKKEVDLEELANEFMNHLLAKSKELMV